jgi:response regulator NasT
MSGIKASSINQQSFRIPVMLRTAYSESDFIEEALKVIGYIVKPISEKDLIPAVEMALGQLQIMQRAF